MDEDSAVSGEDNTYPPDTDDTFDAMELEPVSGPGTPPVPRAAGIRAAAKANAPLARGARTKVKKARTVGRSGGKILTQQKRRQALELRKAGASYHQIAENLGYHDASGARKAVIKAFGEVIQEPVQELRSMQVERLNHMLMVLWPKVQQGEESAINTSLRVMEKMDVLMGTNQAQQMEVNVNQTGVLVIDGNKDDFIAQMKKMAGIDGNGNNVTAQQVPHGTPQAALPAGTSTYAGPQYPPGMMAGQGNEDIVDAELVEDRDESQPEPVRTGEPAQPMKKKFSFGVDPTVRRD